MHCRAHSRAKAHSAKENEADAAATSPGDDPRRRKVGHQRETCVTASIDVKSIFEETDRLMTQKKIPENRTAGQ